jgi:hypothetical protein
MRSRSGGGSCGIVLVGLLQVLTAVPAARAGAAEDAAALSATIDRLVAAAWEENQVTPAPAAGDAEFARRAALDLTGKIPTAGELREFLDDPAADKRARLIERLLNGPSFITHSTNVEMRLLIPETDANQQARLLGPAFQAWLREQIAANAGSDAIARAILTAPVADERTQAQRVPVPNLARYQEPSPLPFYLAKDVKSENLAASTARIFLGLRLECAQCHNHPFARWTREQFWGYAAFFASLEKQGPAAAFLSPIRELPDRREAAVPGTEKVVQAMLLDGSEPRFRFRVPARMALAEWMTDPDNPYFARAAVNRIWAQLFGTGLVDPVDDMGADNPPSHPELLDALARGFAAHGFDRQYLYRAIVLSRPYQLTSAVSGAETSTETGTGPSADTSRLFARMPVRGLTGEQLYDSLVQAIGLAPEEERTDRAFIASSASRGAFLETFARHDEKPTEPQTSILQALHLMNGQVVSAATRLDTGATLSAVAEAPFLDTGDRVETLFLAALSRRPTPDEADRMIAYVERGGTTGDRRTALADVFWALLNSPEFLFNH